MNKVKKALLPALLATVVVGATGAVIAATPDVQANAAVMGEKFANVSLTDGIVFNYFIPKTGNEAPTAVFDSAVNSMDATVTAQAVSYRGNDMWMFQYDKVTPQLMSEKFSITIGGEVILQNYSVEDYCMELNGLTASELGCTENEYDQTSVLVKDLLFYGEASKSYTSGTAMPEDAVYGTVFTNATDKSEFGEIKSANKQNFIQSATVEFDYQPSIRFGFILKAPANVKAFVGEEELTLKQVEGNKYTAVYSGIMATNFDEQVTLTLKEGDTVVHTVKYGINDYVARVQDDSNEKMVTLAKALYNYGASADVVYAIPSYQANSDGTHKASNYQEKTAKVRIEDYVAGKDSLDVKLVTERDWGALGNGSITHGITSDGTCIYGVSSSYAEKVRPANVFRYNPTTDELVASAYNAFGVTGDNCGVTYYNGNIYVYTHDGKVFFLPANFEAGATPVEATGEDKLPAFKLTAEGEEYVPYTAYYSQENAKFAVRDRSNNLYIYDASNTSVPQAGPIAVGISHLTGTSDYLYVSKVATGGYLTMTAYDWSGNKVKDVSVYVESTVSGFDSSVYSSMNTQGVAFVGDKFFFTLGQWYKGNQTKVVEIVDVGQYCVYTNVGDKIGSVAVAGTSTELTNVTVTRDFGWRSFGSSYNHDITSDGRYIYGISANNATARTLYIYRYDTVTHGYVQGPNTGVGVSNESEANITYYNGKVLVYYGTTGKLMAIDAQTFSANSTFSEFNELTFSKDGSPLVVEDFEYNKRTGQYLVKSKSGTYIFERNKATYKAVPNITSAMRIASNENYIFANSKTDGGMKPVMTVYDWSGNSLGSVEVPNSLEIIGMTDTSFNVQGITFANGAFYFTMTRWSESNGGAIFKAEVIDATGMPCYYCNHVDAKYTAFTLVSTPTFEVGGVAQNETGAQITLPALNDTDYDINGQGGVYTFTYKTNRNVVITVNVPTITIDGIVYDIYNLYNTSTMTSVYDGTSFVFTLNGDTTLSSFGASYKNINVVFNGTGMLTVNGKFDAGKGSISIEDSVTINVEGASSYLISTTYLTIAEGATLNVTNNAKADTIFIYDTMEIAGNFNFAIDTSVGTTVDTTPVNFQGTSQTGYLVLKDTAKVSFANVKQGFCAWGSFKLVIVMPSGATINGSVITSASGSQLTSIDANSKSAFGGNLSYINDTRMTINGTDYTAEGVAQAFDGLTATRENYTNWTLTVDGDVNLDSLAGVNNLVIGGTGTLTIGSKVSIANLTIQDTAKVVVDCGTSADTVNAFTALTLKAGTSLTVNGKGKGVVTATGLTVENGAAFTVNTTTGDAIITTTVNIAGAVTVNYAEKIGATGIAVSANGTITLADTARVTVKNTDYAIGQWHSGAAKMIVSDNCTVNASNIPVNGDGEALVVIDNTNYALNVYPDGQNRGVYIVNESGTVLKGTAPTA